jgi:hypothetical protein
MKIEAPNGTVENGTALIGSLDAGGYFTLDAMVIPEQSGPMSLSITIEYTDDFNQPRVINEALQIEVMEAMQEPILEPGMEGSGEVMPIPTEENTFQKIWRFVLGLFGLDSAPPPTNDPGIVPGPGIEEQPIPAQPVPGKGQYFALCAAHPKGAAQGLTINCRQGRRLEPLITYQYETA